MNTNKITLLQIGIALFFAAAMILSSLVLIGTQYEQHSDTVTYFQTALWFIPFSWLAKKTTKKETINCNYK